MVLDRTYQLNVGGNMDFQNMLERERLEVEEDLEDAGRSRASSTASFRKDSVHIGPSDYVPWLDDRKWAYIRMEGRNFGDVPLNLELKLEVWDSPNSAGVIIDALRCAKIGLDRGLAGPLIGPSAYFMKSPPVQFHDDEAYRMVEEFAANPEGTEMQAARSRHLALVSRSRSWPICPPGIETSQDLGLVKKTLVESDLQEVLERGATSRPGLMPRWFITATPSSWGRIDSSSSCSRSSPSRRSSSSMRKARSRALAWLRVVQSQRVSSLSRSKSGPASWA